MGKTLTIVIGILVLALIAFGGYKLWHKSSQQAEMQPTTSMQATVTPVPSSTLQQDSQNIQNSMDKLNQDQNTSTQDTTTQSQDVPGSY